MRQSLNEIQTSRIRRTATCALAALIALTAPAAAAPKRPGPIKGSYAVRLTMDVTQLASNIARATPLRPAACTSVNPKSTDRHDLRIPAAGRLKVLLIGPTGQLDDWDLFLVGESGEDLAESASAPTSLAGTGARESVAVVLGTGQTVSIVVCNVLGEAIESKGTVDYLFTYST
ncbi:MAG TPA: hypothetical protein VNB94_05600 [Mycobacteriales bacterium]|nr:hypothetical protein [Mycobacteriales bacterium]